MILREVSISNDLKYINIIYECFIEYNFFSPKLFSFNKSNTKLSLEWWWGFISPEFGGSQKRAEREVLFDNYLSLWFPVSSRKSSSWWLGFVIILEKLIVTLREINQKFLIMMTSCKSRRGIKVADNWRIRDFWIQYIQSKVRGRFRKILWPSQNI